MEQQLPAGLSEGKIAEFVEDDEVHARKIIGDAPLTSGARFGLEPVDEIDGCEEAPARSRSDAASRDRDGQVRLARAGSSDQDEVPLLGKEAAAGEVAHEGLVDRRVVEGEVVDVLGQRQLGDRELDLAALEKYGDEVRLVFWEAKHFANGELRAKSPPARVVRQVQIYKKYLSSQGNRETIERNYTKVAENLVEIKRMGWKRELSSLITDVGTHKRKLTLGAEPAVGLIIFGFDAAQLNSPVWLGHFEPLREKISDIRAVGHTQNIHLPTTYGPPWHSRSAGDRHHP